MMYCLTLKLPRYFAFFVLILSKPYNGRSKEAKSFFSFTYTDKTSPYHIEETCLAIENNTLFNMYFGIQLFITKTTDSNSCKPQNIELKEIRKAITHSDEDRPLCKTKLTVFISKINCEKAIEELKTFCHDQITENTSIYFQECAEDNYYGKEAASNDTLAITMTSFLTPTIGRFGAMYEIPKVQCTGKQRKADRNSINHSSVNPLVNKTERQGDKENSEQRYNVFVVVGSGLSGFILGVLGTLLMCTLIEKCTHSRTESDGMVPKLSSNLICGNEEKLYIYSNEEGDVYHYIADTPDTLEREDGHELHNVRKTSIYNGSMNQRYDESPRSSTNTHETEKSLLHQSFNKNSNSIQCSKLYHTLSKDFKIESKHPEKMSATDDLYSHDTLRYKAFLPMSVTEKEQQNLYHSLSPGKDRPADTYNDFDTGYLPISKDVSSCVYHVLKEDVERYSEISSTDTAEIYVNTAENGTDFVNGDAGQE